MHELRAFGAGSPYNRGMVDTNPFQILTFIVAPAILTNSSSVLSLSTSNRFARNVDRSRLLYERLKDAEKLLPHEAALFRKQLPLVGKRTMLLVRALTCFYVSVGAFAATAFASIVGAGISYIYHDISTTASILPALACGTIGVLGLVLGTALLVQEMWLAVHFVQAEVDLNAGIQLDPIL